MQFLNIIDQKRFELTDLRARKFANSVWIPLRVSETKDVIGKYGSPGSSEELFCLGSVAFPLEKKDEAEKLGWMDIGISHQGGPYAFKDKPYKPCEIYQYRDGEDFGVDLIFEQPVIDRRPIWHINQDLIMALRLIQEGDVWVRPEEAYIEVLRQRRNDEGEIVSIEIRSEFLRDYLAARRLALRLAYFRRRMAITETDPAFTWPTGGLREHKSGDRFEARIAEVDETGGPYGGGVAIFHAWRTDVDSDEDVPVFGPEDDTNTAGRSSTYKREGDKYYRIDGELWREEWIEPAARSERVRGDDPVEQIFYTVDAAGVKKAGTELNNEDVGQYLWFRPSVVNGLLDRRGSGLQWYTAFTGSIWCSPHDEVHFGVNSLGHVNVYAYDIAKYPQWQQRIWAGHNLSPEGGVCDELLSAQMRSQPARTTSAEDYLKIAMGEIDDYFKERFGSYLFRSHQSADEIMVTIHRFRSTDKSGLLSLAKDLARLIADRIDIGVLHKIVRPQSGEKWGSLKALEKALGTAIPADRAKEIMAPLFGVYELRLGDAHLPSSDIDSALTKARVEQTASPIHQGAQLIFGAAYSLHFAKEALTESS